MNTVVTIGKVIKYVREIRVKLQNNCRFFMRILKKYSNEQN